MLSIVVNSYEY